MKWLVFVMAVVALMEEVTASYKFLDPNLVMRMSSESECPPVITCDDVDTNYRTADGSCNNLMHPDFGKTFTRLKRLGNNTYDDSIGAFRTIATNGGSLPNVREISVAIMTESSKADPNFTLSVMQWSQFMDHDLTHVPLPSLENGESIDCCPTDGSPLHESCMPIDISEDSFYSQYGATCMSFTRSMLAKGFGEDCIFEISEQVNQITHWLDGSNVYGSSQEEQDKLRTFKDGMLRTSCVGMLPINPHQGGECEADLNNAVCYLAGDSRVNEQPGLTAIHTLFLREHNLVAGQLKTINPLWEDEWLFQETRRIVIAEMQNIAYTQWLPIIVGEENMETFNLEIPDGGFTFDYDETICPNMLNEFAAACFRYGHTLVRGIISLFSKNGTQSTIQLRDNFHSPHHIQNEQLLDDIIRGLFMQKEDKYDNSMTEDLTMHLFQRHGEDFGKDLASINLQRGRDHGIVTYNTAREICGLERATDFQDLNNEINSDLIARLESVYDHVNDIDLFTGGLCETSLADAVLGPTFACVVSMQFEKLRKGDRFFYTLGNQSTSFTNSQLTEIRKSSWAQIICDNSLVERIQRDAFKLEGPGNEEVSCSEIDRVTFDPWRE